MSAQNILQTAQNSDFWTRNCKNYLFKPDFTDFDSLFLCFIVFLTNFHAQILLAGYFDCAIKIILESLDIRPFLFSGNLTVYIAFSESSFLFNTSFADFPNVLYFVQLSKLSHIHFSSHCLTFSNCPLTKFYFCLKLFFVNIFFQTTFFLDQQKIYNLFFNPKT